MTQDKIKVIPPLSSNDSYFSIILQGNFSSHVDREEFSQAFTSHGMQFLRLANTPLPTPDTDDLSLIGSLARALSKIRTHQLNAEPQP